MENFTEETFQVFKGVQKPLTFRMFQGRYIYWGIGSIIGGLMSGMGFLATGRTITGLIVMLLVSGLGVFYTLEKQKKGLYSKTKEYGTFRFDRKYPVR